MFEGENSAVYLLHHKKERLSWIEGYHCLTKAKGQMAAPQRCFARIVLVGAVTWRKEKDVRSNGGCKLSLVGTVRVVAAAWPELSGVGGMGGGHFF